MLTEAELKGMVAGLHNGDLSALVGLMGAIESEESGLPIEKTVKIQQRVEAAITDVYYALNGILHSDIGAKEQFQYQLDIARFRLNPSYKRFIKYAVDRFQDDISVGRIKSSGGLRASIRNYLDEACEWVENMDKEIVILLCSKSTETAVCNTEAHTDNIDGIGAMHVLAINTVQEDVLGHFSEWMEKVG